MINRVILLGRVGKDPEIRTMQDGTKVANFSIATSETYKKDGEKKEDTQWHNIVAWRKLADLAESWIKKGGQIYVEGKIQYRTYENKDGNRVGTTDIVADQIRLLGGKREERTEEVSSEPDELPAEGDDLPF